MAGFEAFNAERGRAERKPSDDNELNRAEYFIDRAVNNDSDDPDSIEIETRYMEMHVQNLLDIVTTEPKPSEDMEVRNEAERIIIKLFKNAEYADDKQMDVPPAFRKYKEKYGGSMEKIYSVLASQTLASSGKAFKRYENISFFPKDTAMGSAVVSSLEKRDNGETAEGQAHGANRLLNRILEEFGTSSENIIESWKSSGYSAEDDQMALGAMQNIEAMRCLEKKHPGSVSALYGQFGIRHFGRYPEKLLSEQYERKDDCDKPYGVMFSAVADHNGAFRTGLWGSTDHLWKNLDGKYLLRAFETSGKFGIGKRLIECDRKYGKDHKISFARFCGHGEKNKVIFGKGRKSIWNFISGMLSGKRNDPNALESGDLEGEGFKRARKFFIDSPNFMLTACNAGMEGGITQKLSSAYEGESVGQDYGGSSLRMRPEFDEKGIIRRFVTDSPEWESEAGRYRKGERVVLSEES